MSYVMNGYSFFYERGRHVPSHRRIWEEAYGSIPDGYLVHHINGDKLDNRLENLRLVTRALHPTLHRPKTRDGEAYCSRCGRWLPLTEFFRAKKLTGRQARCRTCATAARKQWARENPDRIAEYNRRRRQKHASDED